jgi:hypothetical protein
LVLVLVFLIFLIDKTGKLFESAGVMDQYRETLRSIRPISPAYLSNLETLAKEFEYTALFPDGKETTEQKTMEEKIAIIRDLLYFHKIELERLRISGKEEASMAEFLLNSTPANFFNFLADMPDNNMSHINYISIKPGSGLSNINITVRFNHVP